MSFGRPRSLSVDAWDGAGADRRGRERVRTGRRDDRPARFVAAGRAPPGQTCPGPRALRGPPEP